MQLPKEQPTESLSGASQIRSGSNSKRITHPIRSAHGNPKPIVARNGGGICGLMTALPFQQLDKGLNILNKINLFAETSTGGVIAFGSPSGLPISTLENDDLSTS